MVAPRGGGEEVADAPERRLGPVAVGHVVEEGQDGEDVVRAGFGSGVVQVPPAELGRGAEPRVVGAARCSLPASAAVGLMLAGGSSVVCHQGACGASRTVGRTNGTPPPSAVMDDR